MFTTTTIDYEVGRHLERMSHPGRRRALLVASLVANLGILAYFKYMNFFLDSLQPLLGRPGCTCRTSTSSCPPASRSSRSRA